MTKLTKDTILVHRGTSTHWIVTDVDMVKYTLREVTGDGMDTITLGVREFYVHPNRWSISELTFYKELEKL